MGGRPKNKAAKYEKSEEYLNLKQDMLDDLELRGLIGRQYIDKVEEYMNLWCWFQMLHQDIVTRGVFVEYSNGATQKGTTENKSLTVATRVSSQMLNIWTALGFREQATSSKPQEDGDGDEL